MEYWLYEGLGGYQGDLTMSVCVEINVFCVRPELYFLGWGGGGVPWDVDRGR